MVVLSVLRGILLTNRNTISRPRPLHLVLVCLLIFVVAALSSIPVTYIYDWHDLDLNRFEFCHKPSLQGKDMIREVWLIHSFATFIPLTLVSYFSRQIFANIYFFSTMFMPGSGGLPLILRPKRCPLMVSSKIKLKILPFQKSYVKIVIVICHAESICAVYPQVVLIYLLTYMLGTKYFSDSYSRKERDKARMVTCVILAFAVLQIPYRIVSIYEAYVWQGLYQAKSEEEAEPFNMMLDHLATWEKLTMCILVLDKALRPILYSKLCSDIGKAFDEVINCTYCNGHQMTDPYNLDNACSVAGSTCGGAAGCAGSFHATWADVAAMSSQGSVEDGDHGITFTVEAVSETHGSGSGESGIEMSDGSSNSPSTPLYDRSMSTESGASTSSDSPLIKTMV